MISIHRAGVYPFEYSSLVGDKNSVAYTRLDVDYNFAGYPSCFWDGGYEVLVGGYSDESQYTSRISSCGHRAVAEPVDLIVGMEHISGWNFKTRVRVTNGAPVNMTPDVPSAPTGPDMALPGVAATIEATTTDADNDSVYYKFDWGDGSKDDTWYGPYGSGDLCSVEHTWQTNGDFEVMVKVKDVFHYETGWSQAMTQTVGCCVMMGDIVPSGDINIEDLVYLVNYMFNQGPVPDCLDAADIDGNGEGPNIADLVYLVNYMFNQGPDPAPCQ
ncbi:MAG: hypothetical protein ABIE70_04005 [bacterium]